MDIKGVDAAKGIAMTGGTIASYRQVLSMFCKDAKERLQLLRFFLFGSMGENKFPEKHLSAFITQVHAVRSASASLGAVEMSEEAARLEEAGNARELDFIWENLSGFIEHLTELETNIRAALEHLDKDNKQEGESGPSALSQYIPLLRELGEALKSQNIANIDSILAELNQKPLDLYSEKNLQQISDQILMAEFESAIKTVEEMISKSC